MHSYGIFCSQVGCKLRSALCTVVIHCPHFIGLEPFVLCMCCSVINARALNVQVHEGSVSSFFATVCTQPRNFALPAAVDSLQSPISSPFFLTFVLKDQKTIDVGIYMTFGSFVTKKL